MKQSEKPGMQPLVDALTANPERGYCSGGQFQNFREGWAVKMFGNGRRSHYFKRDTVIDISMAVATCGEVYPVRWLYGEGTYKRCRNCEKRSA